MKRDYIKLNLSNAWAQGDCVYVMGYAFVDDRYLSSQNLVDFFSCVTTIDEFSQNLQRLNGIFSVIICRENFVVAAIDTTRLYPIFYSYVGETWNITDNPYLILSEHSTISSTSLEQMRSSFAVLEGNTLVEGIYQIKPGSIIRFLENGLAENYQYFHYNVARKEVISGEKSQLLLVLKQAVKRLVQKADGRQIVVPMSAGYDSRIILCLLKEQGYKNVLTYTMGSNVESSEVHIASKVANILGYPHFQIDLNLVGEELDFSDFNNYVMYEGALTNFCWCEEYACVKWLQKRSLLNEDAIFVPGHAGDFFAGSHLAKSLITEHSSMSELVYGILFNNFEANRGFKTSYIREEFNSLKTYGDYPPSLYNAFVFTNRLTHFITNSARAFTFFGYEVVMPLWDLDFLQFMRRLPIEQLHHCALYNECVEVVFEKYNVNFSKKKLPASVYRKQYIKNIISVFLPSILLSKLKKSTIDVLGGWHLANILCKDFTYYANKSAKPYSINSALTEWYIGSVIKLLNKD
jgi:asparagine synthase (glutamine-hydrolysing)